ncbi:MAG: CAP domain-containing protein [Rhodobacteraceae bacterium]|nr:CAP domain-containing protein [Paracoccaceae bacterium]
MRKFCTLLFSVFLLAACEAEVPAEVEPEVTQATAEATPDRTSETTNSETESTGMVPKIFWVSVEEGLRIQYRILDAVNAVRAAKGLNEVQLSNALNAAARTHARDMSVQNRPWHFGSDGSSPLDRAIKAGYSGRFLGENIAESFEDDLATLTAWLDDPETSRVILSPDAAQLGIGWHQERRGKLWWTLVTGT